MSLDNARLADPFSDPASYIEVESCVLCGSSERDDQIAEGRFRVVRCRSCGLGYVTPRLRPDLLPLVYDEGYWTSSSPKDRGYGDYRLAAPLYVKTFEKRYEYIAQFLGPPGTALDVGCAAGFFLKVLDNHGWKVAGVELSPDIAKHAIDEFGFDVHVGELATAPYDPATFDLLTMWDLVEHVPEPVALLENARDLLKPGGVLVIETQNIDSRFAKLLGSRWQHYKHYEHLYHFNRSTITRLLSKAGLRVEQITPRFAGKHVSVGFVRERAGRVHSALSTVLRPLKPLDRVDLYVNLRDEMIVVARKD